MFFSPSLFFSKHFEKYVTFKYFFPSFFRLEEQKNILSEFQRDLSEFVLWLQEADAIASVTVEPENEQQLKEKLEQVTVI